MSRAATARRLGAAYRRLAEVSGARTTVRDGLVVCAGAARWAYARGGTTIGDCYVTGSDPRAVSVERLAHEAVHREQWRRHGALFALRYLAAGRDPARNRYEVEAGLADGGYR